MHQYNLKFLLVEVEFLKIYELELINLQQSKIYFFVINYLIIMGQYNFKLFEEGLKFYKSPLKIYEVMNYLIIMYGQYDLKFFVVEVEFYKSLLKITNLH